MYVEWLCNYVTINNSQEGAWADLNGDISKATYLIEMF